MTGRARARALTSSGALLARQGEQPPGSRSSTPLSRCGASSATSTSSHRRSTASAGRSSTTQTTTRAHWRRSSRASSSAGSSATPPGATRALVGIAQVLVAHGRDRARRGDLARPARPGGGDARTEHFAYHFLADCALIRGDPDEAGARYRREPAGRASARRRRRDELRGAGRGDVGRRRGRSARARSSSPGRSKRSGSRSACPSRSRSGTRCSSATSALRAHRSGTSTTPSVPRAARSPSTTPSSSRSATTGPSTPSGFLASAAVTVPPSASPTGGR